MSRQWVTIRPSAIYLRLKVLSATRGMASESNFRAHMKSNMTASAKTNKVNDAFINSFRKKMLGWYDKHQRAMPWRATNKKDKNPYYTWLSEIMLQQTTVVTVGPYFEKFIAKWPTVHDLAKAERDDVMHEWAGLGYYARARNLHKCAQIVSEELNGVFPQDQKELEKLPGIGGYTSAAIRAIAFDKPANVVDGNIERVMSRIFAVTEPMPDSKKHLKELAGSLTKDRKDRSGDYAQALMDLGATICTPTSPKCALCPVIALCDAKKQGIEAELPKKQPKKAKPHKYGHVFWVENTKNEVLFIRRDEKEMLGGMLGLPTSTWEVDKKTLNKLPKAINQKRQVKHSFTHFDLTLDIFTVNFDTLKASGMILPLNNHVWLSRYTVDDVGLPTLFKKAVKLMQR